MRHLNTTMILALCGWLIAGAVFGASSHPSPTAPPSKSRDAHGGDRRPRDSDNGRRGHAGDDHHAQATPTPRDSGRERRQGSDDDGTIRRLFHSLDGSQHDHDDHGGDDDRSRRRDREERD